MSGICAGRAVIVTGAGRGLGRAHAVPAEVRELGGEAVASYEEQRVQFGRPSGSFQAVKHKCADMLAALEGARAALADRLAL
jgi:alkylation response protein AidB-like acyl-CoA dehydrogenase